MTREEWELKKVIDKSVARHHKEMGGRITKEEAISAIRRGRDKYLFNPGRTWRAFDKEQRSCEISLSFIMIDLICKDEQDDPIRTIVSFYYKMDDILSTSDNPVSWAFAGHMKDAALALLEIIQARREKHENY